MEEKKYERIEYSPMRKAISGAMKHSLDTHSQLTMGITIDATNLLSVRKEIKENYESLGVANASINDIVMYVLARVLKENLYMNGHVGENYFDQYENVHLAFAVDTDKGLITPIIWDASERTLSELATEAKELIAKAHEGKLRLNDIQGGTFTISNLGLSGVQFFTPVINPPQPGILGVGSPVKRLKMVDGQVVEYPEITLSFTMDHGPNDGVAGAKFTGAIAKALENVDKSIIK